MDSNKIELKGIFSRGYGTIPKNIMLTENLTAYDKLILAYMLSFTGGGITCFPSYKKMSTDLQISESTISKSIKNLSNKGFITKEKISKAQKKSWINKSNCNHIILVKLSKENEDYLLNTGDPMVINWVLTIKKNLEDYNKMINNQPQNTYLI